MASCPSSSHDAFVGIEPPSKRRKSNAALKLYDVFISHRGPDVKETLAKTLYNSFQKLGIRAFVDREEIEGGDFFPLAIKNAISSASVQVVIFSKGFAESPWCLAELAFMLERESRIIPVFYQVPPSHLRQVEKGVYNEAFDKYEKKQRHLEKLQQWKENLNYISFIDGYELRNYDHDEDKLCEKVVSAVVKVLDKSRPLEVAKSPVGLDKLVEDFESRCMQIQQENNKVKIVGIFGMGGVGKTTLAKELFNLKRSEYDGSSFLFDVREASHRGELTTCQTKILRDLVQDNPQFSSIEEGKSHLKSRLKSDLRFLIIIDDIDHRDQLDALMVRDELKSGSLIILTTRDKSVLINAQITLCYEMKGMNLCHSRQLFCWHAFRQLHPASGYEALAESFVKECCGLPLSLRVLGSQVCGRPKCYWELALVKIRRTLPGDIMKRLEISFDALHDHEKQIFMDIACFFIGRPTSMAVRIWEGSGWSGELAIQTLKDRSLVEEVEESEHSVLCLRMHDHLRDLGRELADKLSSPRRIWRPEHLIPWEDLKGFQNILTETNVRCFSDGFRVTYFVGNSNYSTETSTVPLWLKLLLEPDWTSIPQWIPLQNVQFLRILSLYPFSIQPDLKRLWHSDLQAPFQLKELELIIVPLQEFTNSIEMLNCLENLVLDCVRERQIEGKSLSESIRKLTHLKNMRLDLMKISGELALNNCGESTTYKLSSLQKIEISRTNISKFSICGDYCPSLNSVSLSSMWDLIEVHFSRVTTLKSLTVHDCWTLERISFEDLQELTYLNIHNCPQLQGSLDLERLNCMEFISIVECRELHSIRGTEDLHELKYLEFVDGNEAAWDCIHSLKKLPSVTIAAGRGYSGVESALNPDIFSGTVDVDAITEILRGENVSVETPESLSAIIICALVTNNSYCADITFPCPPGNSMLREQSLNGFQNGEKWIITIVMAGNNVNCAQDYIDQSKWIGKHQYPSEYDQIKKGYAQIKKGYMVRVKKGEEMKALNILKSITEHLYLRTHGMCPKGWLSL